MRLARSWPTGRSAAEDGHGFGSSLTAGPAPPAKESNRRDLDRLSVRCSELLGGQAGRRQPHRVLPGDLGGHLVVCRAVDQPSPPLDELDVEVVERRSQGEHDPRVGGDAADLDGLGFAERDDGVPIPHEPGGDEVRVSVPADRAQPQHAFLGEEGERARREFGGVVHGCDDGARASRSRIARPPRPRSRSQLSPGRRSC
jgi:hypothetical protein